MITAKPLKRKDLGPSAEPVSVRESRPEPNRDNSTIIPFQNHFGISNSTGSGMVQKKKRLTIQNKKNLVYMLVRDIPGLTTGGVNRMVEQFCKSQGYILDPQDYSGYLRYWKLENKIVRIKFGKVWRWVLKHE